MINTFIRLHRKQAQHICSTSSKCLFHSYTNLDISSGRILSNTQTKIIKKTPFGYLGLSEYHTNPYFWFESFGSGFVLPMPSHSLNIRMVCCFRYPKTIGTRTIQKLIIYPKLLVIFRLEIFEIFKIIIINDSYLDMK